jgi:hypothetical protein
MRNEECKIEESRLGQCVGFRTFDVDQRYSPKVVLVTLHSSFFIPH